MTRLGLHAIVLVSLALPASAGSSSAPDFVILQLDDWSVASTRRFINTDLPGMQTLEQVVRENEINFCDFMSCYVAQPTCSPSRAALLRGQLPRRTGIHFNTPRPPETLNGGLEGYVGRDLHRSNLATWLDAAGYRTAHIGKFLNFQDNGEPRPPLTEDELGVAPLPGWDEWYHLQRLGFGGYHSFTLSENGEIVRYDSSTYSTDRYRDIAVDIVSRTRAEEPLFLHICPSTPHLPSLPAPRHQERRPATVAPRPPVNPAYLEPDVSDKPLFVRARSVIELSIIEAQDEYYRNAANALASIGELTVAVIESLKQAGRLDNAIFFITSDNGWSFLDHRVFGKGDLYEPSSRIPLLVLSKNRSWMPESGFPEQLVSHIDIAATILELAGTAPPAGYPLDAVSFASILADLSAPPVREDLLIEVGFNRPAPVEFPRRRPDWSAVITDRNHPLFPRVKYAEYIGGEKELYLLESDPFELENRAGDPEFAPMVQALRARLEELKKL